MKTNATRNFRSDEEWIQLINECRTSGLSDKEWCSQNRIAISTFYYRIRKLTEKACQFPANPRSSEKEQHDIVSLRISDDPSLHASIDSLCHDSDAATAIRISLHDISVEITNQADKGTILNVLGALRLLC